MSKPINTRGCFITFEGGEGVGKSSNISFCADWLCKQGIDVVSTREPGGTEIAEIIREQLLKAHHQEPMADMTELLLIFAARAQHIERVIQPALAAGKWVLCDRFTDSTLAYQGYGRNMSMPFILNLKNMVQGELEPDCTFLLEAPVALGMSRAKNRADSSGGEVDRFETQSQDFFERVQHGFSELAQASKRFKRIDAALPLEQVQSAIAVYLGQLLNQDPAA